MYRTASTLSSGGWGASYTILPDGSRRITAVLLPGNFCDLHVTTLQSMDHSVTALAECEVAYIDSGLLEEATRSISILTRALLRSTLVDEAILRPWLVSWGPRDAFEGLGHLQWELHLRAQAVGLVSDNRLSIPMTQEGLGDATGLTLVHATGSSGGCGKKVC
ncbi:Crp/Fnr family transcriptional regulator [Sphingomonas melonis]|nr:Crp/Fnr family transcriptional regulator [Sphingomonas melonis]